MARKDKPYLPLYVQDLLTDEKLMECSANAHGVFLRLMCIMHKSETYGTILLKQKDKQSVKQNENFALKLAKHLPFDLPTILSALNELISENVLYVEGDLLIQKRMYNDGILSAIRSQSGSEGGKATQTNKKFAKAKTEANEVAKHKANNKASPDIDNDNVNSEKKNSNKKLYKEFNTKPNEENLNLELPTHYVKQAIEYLDINKQIKKSEGQINVMWETFKLENFTGSNYYSDEKKIFTHFLRSIKSEKNGHQLNYTNGTTAKGNRKTELSYDKP